MKNAINTLRIQNFKSIKDVTMSPRRVNIIIGEPNVGKSNILEAMSLLGGMVYEQQARFMESFIRYEEPQQLFYDNLTSNLIEIETDQELCIIGREKKGVNFKCLFLDKESVREFWRIHVNGVSTKSFNRWYLLRNYYSVVTSEEAPVFPGNVLYTEFDDSGESNFSFNKDKLFLLGEYSSWNVITKFYEFIKNGITDSENESESLSPPHGSNLAEIIRLTPKLRVEIASVFRQYRLKLLMRMNEHKLEVVKEVDGIIYSYPYSSTADTLQRLIFYLAAIESNDDAVLLFEEPEAHSYPVYVSQLARRMVVSRNNQFFVVTHSPYLITEVLEEMLTSDELAPELAMFVAYYEDYQTKVRQLSEEEVVAIRADGLDVFYNMARFVPSADNAV